MRRVASPSAPDDATPLCGESPTRAPHHLDGPPLAARIAFRAIWVLLLALRRMAVHVYEEMLYMRTRSETMQATNESMRGRLLWVEVVMMCIVLVMGLWQIQYLKRYFQVKKLI